VRGVLFLSVFAALGRMLRIHCVCSSGHLKADVDLRVRRVNATECMSRARLGKGTYASLCIALENIQQTCIYCIWSS
jgi:hypothetical protein